MKKGIATLALVIATVVPAFAWSTSPTTPATVYTTANISISGSPGIDNFNEYSSVWTYPGNVMVSGSEKLIHYSTTYTGLAPGTYRIFLTPSPTGGTYPNFPDHVSGVYTVVTPPPPAPFFLTTASTTPLIAGAMSEFGIKVLVILGVVVSIGVAYLVFKFGWRKVRKTVR